MLVPDIAAKGEGGRGAEREREGERGGERVAGRGREVRGMEREEGRGREGEGGREGEVEVEGGDEDDRQTRSVPGSA
eukprot:3941619-Rhodomonas_salina.3